MDLELLRLFAESSEKILFQYHLKQARFLYLSNPLTTILGPKAEAMRNNPASLKEILHPDDLEIAAYRLNDLVSGTPVRMTVRLISEPGSTKYLSVEARRLTNNAGEPCLCGIATDVTQEAEYENYLLEYGRKKNSVLAIVAHDLKAPINHIQGAAEQLQQEQQNTDKELLKLFEIIDQACADSVNLISELLYSEHVKSPEILVKKDPMDVLLMIERILKPFTATNKLGHRFEVNSRHSKVIAELDELKFMQVVNNLVMNSVKFTPSGGTITITVDCDEDTLHISHSDTGIGVPEDMQPYIFSRHTFGRAGLRGEASYGVGLSIVKELVERQGGTIRMQNNKPTGTIFYLTFSRKAV